MGCGASHSERSTPTTVLSQLQEFVDRGELGPTDRRQLIRLARQAAGKPLDSSMSAPQVQSFTGIPYKDEPAGPGSPKSPQAPPRDPLHDLWAEAMGVIGREEFGRQFHDILEREQPQYAVLFDTVGSAERKALLTVRMIEQVVLSATNQGTVSVASLLASGARHRAYGVEGSALHCAQDIALRVVDAAIDRAFTATERDAWDAAWSTAINLMQHGMTSADGQNSARRFEEASAKVVENAWNKIRIAQTNHTDPEKRVFARAMYAAALRDREDLGGRFSNLRDFRTSDAIMNFITDSIDGLIAGRREEVLDQLHELGARHVNYGLSHTDLSSFEKPFIETCAFYLQGGADRYTMYHLLKFFRMLVESMMSGFNSNREVNVPSAPKTKGEDITIVFTDIEKSTRLWATNPTSMTVALERHNMIVRRLIRRHVGYEVKTVGDSFMVAFRSAVSAVSFACDVQIHLLTCAPIAPGFQMVSGTQAGTHPAECWDSRTLRVRIGIATTNDIQPQYDPIHRRYDYFGPGVNLAARIEAAASGGQTLVCSNTARALERESTASAPRYFVDLHALDAEEGGVESPHSPLMAAEAIPGQTPPGTDVSLREGVLCSAVSEVYCLRGVPAPVTLYNVRPPCLAGRRFVKQAASGGEPRTAGSDSDSMVRSMLRSNHTLLQMSTLSK